jgi:putative DNA primase/helicase
LADAEAEGWNDVDLTSLGNSIWSGVNQKDKADTSTPAGKNKITLQSIREIDPSEVSDLQFSQLFAESFNNKIITVGGRVLAYQEGYWRPLDPDVEIKRPLLKLIGESAKIRRINAIYELAKVNTAECNEKLSNKAALICLKNGTLDPVNRVLHEHSAENYLTNKLDITYQVESTCPLWIKTLEEIFGCDDDHKEKIELIQEFLGYTLIPDTRHAKFIWMVGAGGNGKSVILSIFSALVGKHNISYAQIERLERPAVRAELQDKLLNISSEMSANATLSDSYLKQIVAGETIEAERKFERPFSFKATARLIAATNTLPRLLDHSDGFARRAIILRFNRQFKESERDINRESKLMKELPGILNWALEGLNRLQARGRFISPKSSINELAQYRLDSDPIKLFAEDYLVATDDKGIWVRSSSLYANYKEWSATNGYNPLSAGQFGKRLEEMGFKKIRSSHGIDWKAKYEDKTIQLPQAFTTATSTERHSVREKISGKYNV